MFVVLLSLVSTEAGLHAQEADKPLIWAADEDGGIPYVFKNANGDQVGFEVDLAEALAGELGRPIHFMQYSFENLLNGLADRRDFDFAMNGLEITAENQQRVRFSRPYYLYQLQLVVRKGEKRFRTLEEAKEKGMAIGTLGGSAADRLLKRMDVPREIYDEQKGPYWDLSLGRRVQGVLLDLPVAIYYAVPDPDLKHAQRFGGLEFAGPAFAEGFYGIAVSKDNVELANQLDKALESLLEKGEIKRILQKWELWNSDQYRLFNPQREQEAVQEMDFLIYFPLLLEGAVMTVFLTLTSMALAIFLALPISLCRLYGPGPIRLLAILYVEFFRGIPVLLLLYFLYYGLAGISPDLSLEPWQAAILGFGLNYAAYEAEIYRSGIQSIPVGQWEAAASLGMAPALTFRRIILPQALRVIIPPMTNDLVALFKDTSVVSVISVVELSKQYQILSKLGAGYVEIGLATAALYLMMSVPLSYLSRYLEKIWGGNG
jgi:polar amino acid transport system substrate-binding protein